MELIKVIALNLLIMYPFLELTRLIFWYGDTYAFFSEFIIELGTFWSGWILFNIFLTKSTPALPRKCNT